VMEYIIMEVNMLTGGRTVDIRNPPNSKSLTLCKQNQHDVMHYGEGNVHGI